MGNMDAVIHNLINGAVIFLVIVVIIFLVLREVVCWYWKINSSIALLTEIRDLLAAKGSPQTGGTPIGQQNPMSGEVRPPTYSGGA
jgi:hypothetical protein